jgi:hypothetical protein
MDSDVGPILPEVEAALREVHERRLPGVTLGEAVPSSALSAQRTIHRDLERPW